MHNLTLIPLEITDNYLNCQPPSCERRDKQQLFFISIFVAVFYLLCISNRTWSFIVSKGSLRPSITMKRVKTMFGHQMTQNGSECGRKVYEYSY